MLEIELDKPGDPHWLSKPKKLRKFDPSQQRDEDGKWSETGAGGGATTEPKGSAGHGYEAPKGQASLPAEAKDIADEYDSAPEIGPGAKEAWAKLSADIDRDFAEITKTVAVEKVTGQPYSSIDEMFADIDAGRFKVTTDYSQHPLWSEDQNWKFRVVHDYYGHYKTGDKSVDFSLEGERSAFLSQAQRSSDLDARRALQTEVYGQASAFYKNGAFGKQKVYLPGADVAERWTAPAAQDFITARDRNPRGDFFSHLEPGDLKGYKLIMNESHSAGAAVAPDGDIQNVFRNPNSPKGAGTAALHEAVRQGGLMLDAYEYETPGQPGLPDVYRKAGFVETGRMKFNPAYRPAWGPERRPDVVFMAYVGGDQSKSPKSDHYYQPHEWDRAKKESLASADAPGESEIARQLREQRSRRAYQDVNRPKLPPEVDQALRGLGKSVLSSKDREDLKIKTNKKKWGGRPHVFTAAEWTHPNGHPRCVRCGDEEPSDGLCMPELLKWATMLDVAMSGTHQVDSGKIKEKGTFMSKSWIAEFHADCITKGAACSVKWPVCPEKKAAVEKYIREEGGKFNVYSEDGKKLGTHSTRAEAAAQLRAIEANKDATRGYPELGVPPAPVAMKALQGAWNAYAKSVGIVFKSEEVQAEPVEKGVYRVAAPGGKWVYFAVEGDQAGRVEYQRKNGMLAPVVKAEKQRYTLGAVYAPGETDFHGDTMTEVELEKAAWAFAQKDGLTGRVGLMHQSGTEKAGKVVESYVYRGPVWKFKDTSGVTQTITPGTWMLGVVWEPEGWNQIERGSVRGYSLQGVARKFANGEEV